MNRAWASRPGAGVVELDVLVVVEHVLGVVLGFHFGEPPVRVVAVGLPDAARVIVGVEEVQNAGTVGLQGVEECSFAHAVSAGADGGVLFRGDCVDDDVVRHIAPG